MRAKVLVAALTLLSAAALVSTAGAGLVAPPGNGGVGASDITVDHPLTTSFMLRGRIGVTAAGIPYDAAANPSGAFNVSGVPAGSRIVKALLYLTDWDTGASAGAIFAGRSVGPSAPLATEPVGDGHTLGTYRFDVTSVVTGNGVYEYASSGIALTYGSALVVVYKNGSLARNKILINDGAEIMCCGMTSSTLYSGPGRSASGGLIIFTAADDNIGLHESGEIISLNGTAVGGPIDANLGPYASLFDLAAPGIKLTNTVSISTDGDWFGWHLAILSKKKQ
jgi:hypothetical protein